MTGVDHQHSDIIDEAVAWLRLQPIPPRAAVHALKSQFGLTAVEACETIAAARGLQVWRASHVG